MNTSNIALSICLYIIFVLLYGWSSKMHTIIKHNSGHNSEYDSNHDSSDNDIAVNTTFEFTRHYEYSGELYDTIMKSGVCALGKFAFVAWVIVLSIYLFLLPKYLKESDLKIFERVLNGLASITIILTLIMNYQLFIRSIPAFILLLILINNEILKNVF